MIRVLLSAPLCLHIRLSSRFTCWPEIWIVPVVDRLLVKHDFDMLVSFFANLVDINQRSVSFFKGRQSDYMGMDDPQLEALNAAVAPHVGAGAAARRSVPTSTAPGGAARVGECEHVSLFPGVSDRHREELSVL